MKAADCSLRRSSKDSQLMPAEEEGRLQDLPCVKTSSSGLLPITDGKHKFLLLAHSERHHRDLGRLVAAATGSSLAQSFDNYGREFMDALSVHATAKKHSNVLKRLMGYFSQEISRDECQESTDLIGDFTRQLVPLITPITLLRHHLKEVPCSIFAEPGLFRAQSKGAHAAQLRLTQASPAYNENVSI